VKQSAASPPIKVSMTSTGKTPQDTYVCSADPTQTYTSDWNSQNTLTDVYVQNYDTASCSIEMSALAEDDNLVTPHEGTHNIGKAACTACASLPVYGSYLCTSGLSCAGKYATVWTVVFTAPAGYVFTAWAADCVPSDDDVVLTCTGSNPETVAPYQPCSPLARGDNVHISSTPPATASGHGWWLINDCAQVKATVTIQLQEYFSNGDWYNIGSPASKKVYGGTTKSPGSSNRVNARALCSDTNLAGWRSVVKVTLPVQPGTDTYTRPGANIDCTVPLPGSAFRPAAVP
jgi:hypothetical protein